MVGVRGDVAPVQGDPQRVHAQRGELREHLRLVVGGDTEQVAGRLEEDGLAVVGERGGRSRQEGDRREEG